MRQLKGADFPPLLMSGEAGREIGVQIRDREFVLRHLIPFEDLRLSFPVGHCNYNDEIAFPKILRVNGDLFVDDSLQENSGGGCGIGSSDKEVAVFFRILAFNEVDVLHGYTKSSHF